MSRVLYKYLSGERASVLEDLLVRFTPLHELNAPYEGRFVVEPHDAERHAAVLDDYRAEWAQVEVFLSTRLAALGALCLSRTPTNEVMWAHYAADHSGFVIGIRDEPNPFEGPAFIWSDYRTEIDLTRIPGFGSFRDVEYRDEPYRIAFGEDVPLDALFRKTSRWSYEEEVRILRTVYGASRIVGSEYRPIYLFAIPSPALVSVVLGANASDKLKNLARALRLRSETAHVVVQQARIDHRRRWIVCEPLGL